jgi:hypothetical protein
VKGSMEVKRKPIANSTASPLESLVKPVNGPAPPCTRHSQKKHHISTSTMYVPWFPIWTNIPTM